jgi:hypothetical protein
MSQASEIYGLIQNIRNKYKETWRGPKTGMAWTQDEYQERCIRDKQCEEIQAEIEAYLEKTSPGMAKRLKKGAKR